VTESRLATARSIYPCSEGEISTWDKELLSTTDSGVIHERAQSNTATIVARCKIRRNTG